MSLRSIHLIWVLLTAACLAITQAMAQAPKASKQTLKADVATPDALVRALYETISGPVGQERDWTRFRNLWLPGAKIILASQKYHGKSAYESLSIEPFIQRVMTYYQQEGFYEKELAGRMNQFGHIASYWSTFEVRKGSPAGTLYARGISSWQMIRRDDRWWISQLIFDFESNQLAIPDRYLQPYRE